MIDLNVLLGNVLLFVALVVPGAILGKRAREGIGGAERLITDILTDIAMPFLVLEKFTEIDVSSIGMSEMLCCILFSIGIVMLLYLISRLLFRKKGKEDKKCAVSRFCSVFPNCGFLGIPLAVAVFPNEPKVAVLVSLFNVFSTFMLLTFGIYVLSGDCKSISVGRAFLKPITVAVVIGFVLSFSGLSERLPVIHTYSGYLAGLTTPLAMTVLGFELSKLGFKNMFATPSLYGVAALKLIVSPMIALAVLLLLRFLGVDISLELAAAMLISTGVSTAATAPAMSERYGADGRYAAILTLGTTVFCVLSLPLVSLVFELFF